ncbi:MAG: hypothetical protein HY738_14295 [Bacteroidia bacterium]|nr:hypothetical protein [Bacteroidia bacterium]
MKNTKQFIEKNTMLVKEFDKYVLEHPEFGDNIPNNALLVMQINDDEEFNQWARQTGLSARDEGNPIVYITITELKQVRSRIEKLKFECVD